MGKKINLVFNKIPFMKLINKIKMKFNVFLTEESYTYKSELGIYNRQNVVFIFISYKNILIIIY